MEKLGKEWGGVKSGGNNGVFGEVGGVYFHDQGNFPQPNKSKDLSELEGRKSSQRCWRGL